jgi:hypothetical protein
MTLITLWTLLEIDNNNVTMDIYKREGHSTYQSSP